MKKDGLIHNTVNQTTFLEWITSTYDGLIIEKTSNHSRTRERLQSYSRAIKLYNSQGITRTQKGTIRSRLGYEVKLIFAV